MFAAPASLGLRETWAAALEEWASATGAGYNFVEYDLDSSADISKILEIAPTLVLIPHRLIPELVAGDHIATIPAKIRDSEHLRWFELLPGVREKLTAIAGETAVLPVTCETLVCCFRADLLEAAGRPLPGTWEEYDALRASLNDWAPGLMAVEPWAPEFRSTMFLARASAGAKHPGQYSLELDVASGEPLIASAPFVQTLEDVQHSLGDTGMHLLEWTPAECRQALLDGRAAMGITYEPAASDVQHQSPPVRDPTSRLKFAPLPGQERVFNHDTRKWEPAPGMELNQPVVCGFAGLSVIALSTASPRQIDAAWDLWGTLQTFQSDGTIPALPGTPCRRSLIDAGSPPAGAGLTIQEWSDLRAVVASNLASPQLVFELPCSARDDLLRALSEALAAALVGGESAQDCLESAATAWRTIIDASDRQRVLHSYRASLGLSSLR